MSKISFVYFDVGGVAIRDYSDSDKWTAMMDYMGVSVEQREEFNAIYKKYDDQVCLGLDINALTPIFKAKLNLDLAPDFSLLDYFVDHFERNTSLWPIMQKIKVNHKIGLLTDMYPRMLAMIQEKKLLPEIVWDAVIDSSVEKVRKPTPEMYALAASRAGVPAEEILFIDNRTWNVDGAKKAGWQTYLYDSSNYDQANLDLANFLDLSEK